MKQVASTSADANLTAAHEANEVKMNDVQCANEMANRNLMIEIDVMEKKYEVCELIIMITLCYWNALIIFLTF